MTPAQIITKALKKGVDIAVCFDCARSNGGQWPKGHAATCWVGECDVCLTEKSCCALSDWNWPGRTARVGREV